MSSFTVNNRAIFFLPFMSYSFDYLCLLCVSFTRTVSFTRFLFIPHAFLEGIDLLLEVHSLRTYKKKTSHSRMKLWKVSIVLYNYIRNNTVVRKAADNQALSDWTWRYFCRCCRKGPFCSTVSWTDPDKASSSGARWTHAFLILLRS